MCTIKASTKRDLAHFSFLFNVENIFARFDKLALFGQMSDASALENVNPKVDLLFCLFLWGMHWQGGERFSFQIFAKFIVTDWRGFLASPSNFFPNPLVNLQLIG